MIISEDESIHHHNEGVKEKFNDSNINNEESNLQSAFVDDV